MKKIFVSIASYRDPELLPTLRDLLDNADNPNNLTICIGWQHADEDEWDKLDDYKNDKRFIIIDIPYKEAKGVCWMRAEIQKYITNQDYYLQLDSHHRFIKGWDTILKDWLNYLRCKGIKKPILSSYIASYSPKNDPKERLDEVWGLNVQRFMPQGVLFLEPHGKGDYTKMKEPFPSRFVSAHMIFSPISFPKEVPYDPNLYFHGEESSLAARAYTYGYDLFSPHFPIIWHEYHRNGKRKHWDDNNWGDLDKDSYARYRKLMGSDFNSYTQDEINLVAPNYFGKERSFEEYEKYIGIKFKTRQIHQETLKNEEPPIKGNFETGLTDKQKYCIDLYKGSLTENDYDVLALAFLNENDEDIFRKDIDEIELQKLYLENGSDNFLHIWREFYSKILPKKWRIWPHSKSKGWCEKIEQIISYE